MGDKTKIAWSDATWSPLRARIKPDALQIAQAKGYTSLVQILTAKKPNGELRSPPGKVGPHCEHVSPGCGLCYSGSNNRRCLPANGTGLPFDRRSRDLVEIFLDKRILTQPLHWKRPRKIFVNSQTDTWGEFIPDEMIDRIFAVAALCPHHVFQFLTKRAHRMSVYMRCTKLAALPGKNNWLNRLPLPNVWLGVSAEDQQRADERIPWLLETPAAVRFVSYEPAFSAVDFAKWLYTRAAPGTCRDIDGNWWHAPGSCEACSDRLDWIVIGGESGRGARPFQLEWARDTIRQCKEARVSCFVKQVGKRPLDGCFKYVCEKDPSHGGNPEDWPRDIRVREMPL